MITAWLEVSHECQTPGKHTWVFSTYRKLLPWYSPPTGVYFFVPNELSTFIPHLLHSIQSLSLLQPSCSRQMSFYPPPHWRPPTHPTQPPPLGPVSASAVIFHRSASEAASPHLLPQVPPTSEAASATWSEPHGPMPSVKSPSARPSSAEWFALILVLQENQPCRVFEVRWKKKNGFRFSPKV